MNKKRWLLVIIGVVLLGVGIFTTTRQSPAKNTHGGGTFSSEEVIEPGDMSQKIGVLEINGTISQTSSSSFLNSEPSYDHQKTLDQLDDMKDDPSIKALVLKVDSPGGTTYASEELYHALQEFKDEKQIPVYVSMQSMAASGGYMISMVGDKIYASNETETGSIGVILESPNLSGFMNDKGIKMNVYKSGDNKDMGSMFRDPTDEESAIYNEQIQNAYNRFVQLVAEGRHMDEGRVRELADGRVYMGDQAVQNGLIDDIGYEDDVINDLKEDYNLQNAAVVNVTPTSNTSKVQQFFSAIGTPLKMKSDDTGELFELRQFMKENRVQPCYLYGGA